MSDERTTSFGSDRSLSLVDRLGTWLSRRSIGRRVGALDGLHVADIGCGFDARLARDLLDRVGSVTLVDFELAPDLIADPRVRAHLGPWEQVLPGLPDASLDVIFCVSVLEHVDDDLAMLTEFRRLLVPGGRLFVNVPSWAGKRALEFSAFRLGLSPPEEMDDHKRYYDPRDLWPLLVAAGFAPHAIVCRRHKLGLNTLAICRVEDAIRRTVREGTT